MAIPRNVCYHEIHRYLILPILAMLLLGIAQDGNCVSMPHPTTTSVASTPPKRAEDFDSQIANLRRRLTNNPGSPTATRVKYTIGVLEFKSGKMAEARAEFAQLARNADCPPSFKILAFNMLAQVNRLEGEDAEALSAFGEMIRLITTNPKTSDSAVADPFLPRLQCLGMFGRAEIYEKQQDNTSNTDEYEKIVRFLSQKKNADLAAKYLPPAYDRLARSYLRQGQVDKYRQAATALLTGFPHYGRNALVRLETLFIQAAQEGHYDVNFASGSAAAQVIDKIRTATDKSAARSLAKNLEKLCRQSAKDPWSPLLRYDCAWLFDALSEPKKAIDYFTTVYSKTLDNATAHAPLPASLADLSAYARIQAAILLAEQDQYKQASALLNGVSSRTQQTGLIELLKAVKENIDILEKEHIRHVQTK